MADDAGGGAAPVPSQVGGDHDIGHSAQQNTDKIPALHNQSRKSTLSKSGFDMHVSGTATPMTAGIPSRHEIQLDDYFVCATSILS